MPDRICNAAGCSAPLNHSDFILPGWFALQPLLTLFKTPPNQSENLQNTSETTFITAESVAACILPILLSLITVVGNCFVILAIWLNQRLSRKNTSILIINLAIADLLVGAIVMPLAAVQIVYQGEWQLGRILCRIWTSLDVICCTASIATLCLISMDRFIGVTRPLQYSRLVTRRRLVGACLFLWLFSLITLLATLRWEKFMQIPSNICYVGNELEHVLHSAILSFFLPLFIILAVYLRIYFITKRRERGLVGSLFLSAARATVNTADRSGSFALRIHYGGAKDDDIEKQRRFYRKHRKSAKTLGLVVGAFLFCWLPFFCLYIISTFCNCIPGVVLDIFGWIGYGNSTINPIIYALTMKTFGDTFKSILIDHIWSSLRLSFRWNRSTSRTQQSNGAKQVSFANQLDETHQFDCEEITPLNADLRTQSDYASDNSTVIGNSCAIEHLTNMSPPATYLNVVDAKQSRKYFRRRCQPMRQSNESNDSQPVTSSSFMNLKLYQTLIGSQVSHL